MRDKLTRGTIAALCTSAQRGVAKTAVERARLIRGFGLEGDGHGGSWHRQVSLLERERVDQMGLELAPGAFGENILTQGIDLGALEVGRRLRVGRQGVVQLTQRGKECHTPCAIAARVGECIMPSQGIFARVVRGDDLAPGDAISTDPDLDCIRYAVVTLSDRAARGQAQDTSGPLVRRLIEEDLQARLVGQTILPDERAGIEEELIRLCDQEVCDLVITSGGTGLAPRDVTPEATMAVLDRSVPGMAEAIRAAGMVHTPRAMLSRGVCGLRGNTLIINLSGSPRAVQEQLSAILPALAHALQTASGLPQSCARP